MAFRVSSQINTQIALRNIQRQQTSISTLQQQISSGVKLRKPSDDPLGIRAQILLQDRQSRMESHQRSLGQARQQLDQAHNHLMSAHTLLVRAQQIGLEGVQSVDAVDRRALAAELDGILNELTRLANDRSPEGSLFGGAALDIPPYKVVTPGEVIYQGADAPTALVFGDSSGQETLIGGSRVFDTPGRGLTMTEGSTGVLPGSGTDTASGVRELQVVQTGTSIGGTSGLQSSVVGIGVDTLIGTHELVINDTSGSGASGTIAFVGGSQFTFTNADTALQVTGPGGEVIYVDTTAISPGFVGTITVEGQGALSVDGGLTLTPITFSPNQVIQDSRDGTLINLHTEGVRRAGVDRIEFLETTDAFETIRMLKEDLLQAIDLPSSVAVPRLQRRLGDLQRIQDHVLDEVGQQSVRLENLDRLEQFFKDQSYQAKLDITEQSAADIPASVVQLQQAQYQYQYTLSSISRLYDTSLLTFLR